MTLAPAYLAAFRGGSPPHPMHPRSRAFHAQHVEAAVPDPAVPLLRHGTGPDLTPVFAIAPTTGEPQHWYRLDDFVRLVEGAHDERYRALADVVRRIDHDSPVSHVLRAVRQGATMPEEGR